MRQARCHESPQPQPVGLHVCRELATQSPIVQMRPLAPHGYCEPEFLGLGGRLGGAKSPEQATDSEHLAPASWGWSPIEGAPFLSREGWLITY